MQDPKSPDEMYVGMGTQCWSTFDMCRNAG